MRNRLLSPASALAARPLILAATLCAFAFQPLHAQNTDVTGYDAFKTAFYTQAGAAQPSTASDYLFANRIFLNQALNDLTPSATVTAPDTTVYNMTPDSTGTVYQHRSDFATQAAMDTQFAGGDYLYSLSSGDPNFSPASQSGNLAFPATFSYARSVPYFTNYSAIQQIDPSKPFTFQWNLFSTDPNAPISDIFLVVSDVTKGFAPVVNQFIPDSTATSFTIPSGTLNGSDMYQAIVYFSERDANVGAGFNSADGSSVNGLAGYDLATSVNFQAVPEPSTELAGLSAASIAIFQLRFRRPRSQQA